ncbi:MAG: hypothetical protein FGM33_01190 [Candidatus Kapabacteria bacterium]|nr:hypothetical protein [Candidatus Kapabacteria bacterium]
MMMNVLTILALLFSLSALLTGGELERRIEIIDTRIGASSRYDRATGRMRLVHPSATRSSVDTTRQVLVYAAYVPSHVGVAVADCSPADLRQYVMLSPAGSYAGRKIMHVEVDLLGYNARSTKPLDKFTIGLTVAAPMMKGEALQPPVGPRVVNSGSVAAFTDRMVKNPESAQNAVDPQRWYHKARQFIRVETKNDGVALIRAEDVLALGTFGSLDSIGLYWRGDQQPIYINDADGSATFTAGDRIYFLGRRASGDTSYMDEYDTTSVFYLTGTLSAEPGLRFSRGQSSGTMPDSLIRWLDMSVRYERDTGYYHPGNGVDDDHGKLFTPRASLEGFYWATLNARIQQAGRFQVPFIPASGSSLIVRADVVTPLSLTSFDPDHAFDVLLPGADTSIRFEVDGFGRHQVVDTLSSETFPALDAEAIVQATGFPERSDSSKWASLVLVDGFDIAGKGASIAQGGRLSGQLDLTVPVELELENLPDKGQVMIDTMTKQIVFLESNVRSYSIRAAAHLYRDAKRPLAPQQGRFTVSAAIGDMSIRADSVTAFALVRLSGTPSKLIVQQFADAQTLAQAINSIAAAEPLVLISVAASPNAEIINALRNKGVQFQESALLKGWIASCAAGNGTVSPLASHVSSYRTDNATGFRSRVELSTGRHALYFGSGVGIEAARVMPATNEFISKRDWTHGTDAIAIVYRAHMDEARRWARHREAFSNIRVSLFDVESIFEAYGAGRHSPHAIKAFLVDAWQRSKQRKPTHCVLIGNASWDIRVAVKGSNVDARRQDQIPSYGNPVSDFWYGMIDDDRDLITPELIVSRLPAMTTPELRVLVDKIITADTIPYAPYQRRFLYAGGGKPDENFCVIFQRILRDEFGSGVDFSAAPLCIDTVVVCKEDFPQPGRAIRSLINEGVGLVNFFGHGGTESFDIEDWRPWQLANEGRYPVLATFSCLTGGFASPSTTCENSKYLFEPRYGASAAIGSTGLQYVATADFLLYRIHEVLERTKVRAIGALMYEVKRSVAQLNTTFGNNATYQFSLIGDPFTRIRIDTAVEVSLPRQSLRLSTRRAVEPIVETDSVVTIDLEVWSQGIGTNKPVEVRLRRTYNGDVDSTSVVLQDGVCRTSNVRFELDVAGMPGRHEIDVTVDPEGILEDRPDDNVVRLGLDVAKPSLLILEPETDRVIHPDSITVRVIDVLSTQSATVEVNMALCRSRDTLTSIVRSTPQQVTRVSGTAVLDWSVKPPARIDTSTTYWVAAWPVVSAPNVPVSVQWQPISFSYGRNDVSHHRLLADDVRRAAPEGAYDSAAQRIVMPYFNVPLSVRSAGKPTSDPVRDPSMSFRLRDSVLLENSFRIGLNVLVFSVYDSLPRLVRRYDTSPSGSPIETGHDGYAQECITFLRDSVAADDIIALAACDESFTRFERDGLFDDFKALLSQFGAKKVDSITAASSYAFIGSRGYQRLTPVERLARSGAVVIASGAIPFTWDTLQVAITGQPVSRWKSIGLDSRGDVRLRLQRKDISGRIDTVTTSGSWNPDVNFDYTIASLALFATDTVPLPSFRMAELFFTPRPQVIAGSVVPDGGVEAVLRGDTMIVNASTFNARFQHGSVTVPVRLVLRDTSGASIGAYDDSVRVQPNTTETVRLRVPTDGAPKTVFLEMIVDDDGLVPMRYRVMSRTQGIGSVSEDTTSPRVDIYADGSIRRDGDAVADRPLVEILLLDQSRLPIENPDNMVVFVNGTRIRPDNVEDWQFIGTRQLLSFKPDQPMARALLRFRFPMETGENLIIIRSKDASGNPDTAEVSLIRPNESSIRSVGLFPNPVRSGIAKVDVDIALVDASGQLLMSAFDAQGRRTFLGLNVVSTGRYIISLDGPETILPNGFYTLVLELQDMAGKTLSTATKKLVVTP